MSINIKYKYISHLSDLSGYRVLQVVRAMRPP